MSGQDGNRQPTDWGGFRRREVVCRGVEGRNDGGRSGRQGKNLTDHGTVPRSTSPYAGRRASDEMPNGVDEMSLASRGKATTGNAELRWKGRLRTKIRAAQSVEHKRRYSDAGRLDRESHRLEASYIGGLWADWLSLPRTTTA